MPVMSYIKQRSLVPNDNRRAFYIVIIKYYFFQPVLGRFTTFNSDLQHAFLIRRSKYLFLRLVPVEMCTKPKKRLPGGFRPSIAPLYQSVMQFFTTAQNVPRHIPLSSLYNIRYGPCFFDLGQYIFVRLIYSIRLQNTFRKFEEHFLRFIDNPCFATI